MTRRRPGYAPLAPLPADPTTCRWCSRRLSAYSDGALYCESGCAAADNPLYSGHCQECHRDFETGCKWAVDHCWGCEQREMDALSADQSTVFKPTGYMHDMRKRETNREAMKILKAQQNAEPADADGEAFRGDEAKAFDRDQQAEIQRQLK